MTIRARRPSSSLGSTLGAAAVAAIAVVAAITVKRRAASVPAGSHRLLSDALAGRPLSATELQGMPAGDFHKLCAAYYQRLRFRLHGARTRRNTRDATLYFGTLPYPVAIVRSIASGAEKVDVGAISDLADRMSRLSIGKGIVHAPGGYTDAAI
ncbi:MAG TPA: hypothetical protein VNT02_09400, partial [Burkholderiales bacterium]|nr:hypothetical protein [Burkholderiales bacterium]